MDSLPRKVAVVLSVGHKELLVIVVCYQILNVFFDLKFCFYPWGLDCTWVFQELYLLILIFSNNNITKRMSYSVNEARAQISDPFKIPLEVLYKHI